MSVDERLRTRWQYANCLHTLRNPKPTNKTALRRGRLEIRTAIRCLERYGTTKIIPSR